jgi:hypothetical protein
MTELAYVCHSLCFPHIFANKDSITNKTIISKKYMLNENP